MIGKCAICRKERELSYEHIPPKGTGNKYPVKQYSIFESLTDIKVKPWEFEKMRWNQIKQQGQGYTSICKECNNKFGSWYVKKYIDFINQLMNPANYHRIEDDIVEVTFNNIYPLEILKQILSMFMTINSDNNLFKSDSSQYLLNKESNKLPVKLKIYAYINNGSLVRYVPLQIAGTNQGLIQTSELGLDPIGFIIYHDIPSSLIIDCSEITFFNNFKFNEAVSFSLRLKIKEVNSIISNDFRKKSEF